MIYISIIVFVVLFSAGCKSHTFIEKDDGTQATDIVQDNTEATDEEVYVIEEYADQPNIIIKLVPTFSESSSKKYSDFEIDRTWKFDAFIDYSAPQNLTINALGGEHYLEYEFSGYLLGHNSQEDKYHCIDGGEAYYIDHNTQELLRTFAIKEDTNEQEQGDLISEVQAKARAQEIISEYVSLDKYVCTDNLSEIAGLYAYHFNYSYNDIPIGYSLAVCITDHGVITLFELPNTYRDTEQFEAEHSQEELYHIIDLLSSETIEKEILGLFSEEPEQIATIIGKRLVYDYEKEPLLLYTVNVDYSHEESGETYLSGDNLTFSVQVLD